ncbi:amidohydrolase [Terriglobus aquaticus]|uniref:Amidohydrolase n=1 Tax=Terriglobus aquaticus TaxID=940139 RepID=A0ABW9KF26_9BACT|nr:amidohydrolase [Terriglobus aquaticus]
MFPGAFAKRVRCSILALLLASAAFPLVCAQDRFAGEPVAREIDPAIARVLAETPAIDNHAHPQLAPPAFSTDRGFDALPVDNMAPETDPLGWRDTFPPLSHAWKALWNFDGTPPLTPAQQTQLEAARERVRTREGEHYAQWVLDQAGIGTELANRVNMGAGVQAPRFRWVPYDDALLFPLDDTALRSTPDRQQFFALEDKLRATYLSAANLQHLPPTLDAYLAQVVLPTLQQQKQGGAVAIKFELAYLREFGFEDVSQTRAAAIYARFVTANSPAPTPVEYKPLQDFLFRAIALEAGRLGMAVHLHGMAGGGRYFSIAGVNPLLLEPLLNDPRFAGTNFVLLHGGWPYVREAGAMLQKPNFYLDISQEALLFSARTLAGTLREWLELYPEKVLFATDAYPYSPANGWEEAEWYGSGNARTALGLALTGMLHDGVITESRAEELARMVLRSNAEHLYRLSPQ